MPPTAIWVEALVQSSTIITMAFGMVLVFGILGILNWAHGQFYMLGAILVYYGVTVAGIPFPFSILMAGIVVGCLGIGVKLLLMDRVTGHLYIGVLMLSMIFFLEGAASMIFGIDELGLSSVMPGVLNFGLFSITYQKLAVVIFTIVVLIAMYFVLNRTKVGLAIRATAQEPIAASLHGIRADRISIIVMGIGCMLAAWAGSIMAPIYAISPFVGRAPMIWALLAMVIGGIGSLKGAVVGGLILGLVTSVGSYYISYFSEVVIFIFIIILLLVRPQGLFGEVQR
jgi:branched-chain amino acid transport system permease protein